MTNMAQRRMIITWMDDRQEIYPFTHQETKNGELHLWTEYSGGITMQERHDERWFTIDNIRTRTVMDT